MSESAAKIAGGSLPSSATAGPLSPLFKGVGATGPTRAKGGAPRKYQTEEERQEARREARKRYVAKGYLDEIEALKRQIEGFNYSVVVLNRRVDKVCDYISSLQVQTTAETE